MDKLVEEAAFPNPVDRHVGLRIRMRRKELGISQERLAESIGLTFQQVQKYERAANRVSASKLWEMSRALSTNISYFYEGLGDTIETPGSNLPRESIQDFLLTPKASNWPRSSRRSPRAGSAARFSTSSGPWPASPMRWNLKSLRLANARASA